MNGTVALLLLAPPALFGVMIAVEVWWTHPTRRHRGWHRDCEVCAEIARNTADHPTGRVGPPQEWLP